MAVSPVIEVVAPPAQLGECPIWHSGRGELFWIDIEGRRLHRWNPSSDSAATRDLPGRPGSMVFTDDEDTLLVAMEHELVWYHWPSETVTPFVTLEEPGTGNRLNDGRTDPAGRYVVGSMHEKVDERRFTGLLHQIEADGTSQVLRRNIGVTNANAFDPLLGRAYFADSFTGRILTWDYDADAGVRTGERLLFAYDDIPGSPDGACVDVDGCLWSASVHGWAVIRITPNGRLDRRIDLPVQKPTMPCFGGSDLSTLYITSIGGDATSPPPEGVTPVAEGSLLAFDVDVEGIPEVPFAGTAPRLSN
ncbi:MAG: SMP-30/gluconolactonase/LRE family protein [Acidimicrobiia bacterium]|nr:SMP-30/gluconolactonase/LRE family protein [Acidimicrobiia bacterium]